MGKWVLVMAGLAAAALAFILIEGPGNTPLRESVETPDGSKSASRSVGENEFASDPGSREIEVQAAPDQQASTDELPPPEFPVDLPPQFDDWLADLPPQHFHHEIEREPYDPDWAPAMEQQLTQYLNENPSIIQEYGAPTIACRTERCELAFVAYGLDATLDDVDIQLAGHVAKSLGGFCERPEFEQFFCIGGMPGFHSRTENGVTAMIWMLWATED